jgi:hypothetical protein
MQSRYKSGTVQRSTQAATAMWRFPAKSTVENRTGVHGKRADDTEGYRHRALKHKRGRYLVTDGTGFCLEVLPSRKFSGRFLIVSKAGQRRCCSSVARTSVSKQLGVRGQAADAPGGHSPAAPMSTERLTSAPRAGAAGMRSRRELSRASQIDARRVQYTAIIYMAQ